MAEMVMTSRTKYLLDCLTQMNAKMAIKALYLVMNVMNAKNGFTRHNGTDYFLHLVDVTQIIYNYGVRDDDILAAALLHDIVEDCCEMGYDIEYIEREFNKRIATMVDLVTKKPEVNYKIAENMMTYLEAIFNNIGAALIKTADRMHNFGTLGDATRAKILKQCIETKTFFIPFFKRCRNQYPEFAAFFYAAKTMVEPHIREIEAHQKEIDAHKQTIEKHEKRIKELERQILLSRLQRVK